MSADAKSPAKATEQLTLLHAGKVLSDNKKNQGQNKDDCDYPTHNFQEANLMRNQFWRRFYLANIVALVCAGKLPTSMSGTRSDHYRTIKVVFHGGGHWIDAKIGSAHPTAGPWTLGHYWLPATEPE